MKHKRFVILVCIILLSIAVILFVPLRSALVFYEENTDNIEAFLPVETGDTFHIIFTHSIHKTDVVEKYEVMKNGDIRQYEIVYEEFGIGMPSNALEGETFVYENGKYHIKDLDNYFPSMNIRNGETVSENRLAWGPTDKSSSNDKASETEHLVWFNEYFEPGAWFTVKIETLTLWEYMKGVKVHE
ncbi:DUF1850 domain-containing protein [Virgibacillus ainsalahensis]